MSTGTYLLDKMTHSGLLQLHWQQSSSKWCLSDPLKNKVLAEDLQATMLCLLLVLYACCIGLTLSFMFLCVVYS